MAERSLDPAEVVRRRGRRRQRSVRVAVLGSAVPLAVAVALGVGLSPAQPVQGSGSPAPTTPVAPSTPSATTRDRASTTPPPITAGRASRVLALRPDGLAVVSFGAAQGDALAALEGRLGPPDERGAWGGASPFGTCPGPVRAVRWGRLYVLFTSGPTRFEDRGRWHLFAYQVDTVQRSAIDPGDTGPTPPDPPRLRGASPRTVAGVGVGSTLAELRAAYGDRVTVSSGPPGNGHRFQVRFGPAGALSGSLSGPTPAAAVTVIAAGAGCGE